MVTPESLSSAFRAVAARRADAVALVEVGGSEAERSVSFAELEDLGASLAEELADRGVGRGSVVGVWLPNVVEAVALELAAARLGAAIVGLNTRYGEHELVHLLGAARPVGLVAPASFHGIDFQGRLGAVAETLTASGHPVPGWVGWIGGDVGHAGVVPGSQIGASRRSTGGVAVDDGAPGDPVNYFTTSGSTGLPKLAGHDQAAVVRHSRNAAAAFGMDDEGVSLGVLPMSGVFGFNHVMAMLLAGGSAVLVPVFDPLVTVQAMARHRVTHVIAGDDLFLRLRQGWDAAGRPELAFRRGGIADFAGNADTCVAWADEAFGADVTGVYGSSEVFALTAVWPAGLARDDRARGGGRLVSDDIDVRIVDPASGDLAPPGATGEIQLKGYNVVTDYLGPVASPFTEDGWFRTGDLGVQAGRPDELVYVCRAGDALRLRGFLVEPAEIEGFIRDLPGVETVKVVAVRDGEEGDVAVAFVTASEDAAGAAVTAEGVLAAAKAGLAPYKVPRAIRVVAELPVTSGTNGTKIRTGVLREWAQELVAPTREASEK